MKFAGFDIDSILKGAQDAVRQARKDLTQAEVATTIKEALEASVAAAAGMVQEGTKLMEAGVKRAGTASAVLNALKDKLEAVDTVPTIKVKVVQKKMTRGRRTASAGAAPRRTAHMRPNKTAGKAKRSGMSAEMRKEVSERMKKYWAGRRKAKAGKK